jgi:hypothetical protein
MRSRPGSFTFPGRERGVADVDLSGYELLLSEPEIVAWLEAEEPEDGDDDEALQAAWLR